MSQPAKTTPDVPSSSEVRERVSSVPRWIRLEFLAIILICVAITAVALYLGNDYATRVLTLVCIYGAAAAGWNVLGGFAAQLSLGHGVFFGLGAYGVAIAFGRLQVSPWIGILGGLAASLLVALIIGLPTFRLSGHYFALGTLALLQVFLIIATTWAPVTNGPQGIYLPIRGRPVDLIFESRLAYLGVGLAVLVIALVVAATVRRSKLGVELDAIRLNEAAASLAGVDVLKSKMIAFLLSAGVVSLAGAAYMVAVQFIDPHSAFSWTVTINMALFAIVGGMRLWWGPAFGAALLVPLQEFTTSQFRGNFVAIAGIVYGLLLITFVLLQPRGLGGALQTGAKRLFGRRSQ